MLFSVSLIIFIFGLITMAVIVVRKFPQLSNVDLEHLPEEQEAKKKREILLRRIEAERQRIKERWERRLFPLRTLWGALQLRFRRYVGRIERLWHHEERTKGQTSLPVEPVGATTKQVEKIEDIIQEARHYFEVGSYEKAEMLFITAISRDPKSSAAYRGLADTYTAQGSLLEAEETYLFLHRLEPHDDMVLAKLGELAEHKDELEKAIGFYQQAVVINDSLSPRFYHLAELLLRAGQPATAREAIVQAVELEPNNPKYLDLLTEVGVLCGDKDLATQGYTELRLLNPRNKKLSSLWERIKSL